jgi:RNA polymerase sigma-70 factor (ECF subfamily)
MENSDIILRLKAGDNAAYKILYDEHYSALCLYAYKVLGNSYTARTVVNDVIFSIWKNRSTLQIQNLRAYLLTAVRNRCFNTLTEEKRRGNIYSELPEDNYMQKQDMPHDKGSTPIDYLLAKELDRKILHSINKMPQQTREIFLLSRYADLKYHEIADQLAVSVDVVKYHIKQAIFRLREDLQDYFY